MYQCQLCGAVQPARAPAHRIILETRARTYPERKAVHLVPKHKKKRPKRKEDEYLDDPGSKGLETVQEALVCSSCAATHTR
jgi:hypothetical protein